ncbi:hypothetical protein [Phaeodactylibacter xiamenensis]|uniref:hypothetical protein n=1 Tax=Phaeodactylibacter xiamenensis TaxID=1524460 RepID=UPI003CCBB011
MQDIKKLTEAEETQLREIIRETGFNLQDFAIDFFGLKNKRALHSSSAAARYKRAIIKFYKEFYQPPNAM